jgi:hypothetical protein
MASLAVTRLSRVPYRSCARLFARGRLRRRRDHHVASATACAPPRRTGETARALARISRRPRDADSTSTTARTTKPVEPHRSGDLHATQPGPGSRLPEPTGVRFRPRGSDGRSGTRVPRPRKTRGACTAWASRPRASCSTVGRKVASRRDRRRPPPGRCHPYPPRQPAPQVRRCHRAPDR